MKIEANALTSAALPNLYIAVMKNPGANLTVMPANAVGISDNKRFVIHQEMVMLQPNQNIGAAELGGNPRMVFNGVITIPRGYRRNGPADKMGVEFLAPGVNANVCVQVHYKEFR